MKCTNFRYTIWKTYTVSQFLKNSPTVLAQILSRYKIYLSSQFFSCPFPVNCPHSKSHCFDFLYHKLVLSLHKNFIQMELDSRYSCVMLLLLSKVFLRFTYVAAKCSIEWMYWRLFMQSPVDGHQGYFHFAAAQQTYYVSSCTSFWFFGFFCTANT